MRVALMRDSVILCDLRHLRHHLVTQVRKVRKASYLPTAPEKLAEVARDA